MNELTKLVSRYFPYGIICETNKGRHKVVGIKDDLVLLEGSDKWVPIQSAKPCLRRFNSITVGELAELKSICTLKRVSLKGPNDWIDYGNVVFTHHVEDNGYTYKPKFSFRTIEWLYMHHMYIPPFDEDNNIEDLLRFLSFEEYEEVYGPTCTYGKNPAFK